MKRPPPVAQILAIVFNILTSLTGWAANQPFQSKTLPCDDIPDCRDHVTKAYREIQSKNFKEALQHYELANQLSPSATLMYHIGAMLYELHKYELARRLLKDAQRAASPRERELVQRITMLLNRLPETPLAASAPAAAPPLTVPAQQTSQSLPANSSGKSTVNNNIGRDGCIDCDKNNIKFDIKNYIFPPGQDQKSEQDKKGVGSSRRTLWFIGGTIAGVVVATVGVAVGIRYGAYPDPPGNIIDYWWN